MYIKSRLINCQLILSLSDYDKIRQDSVQNFRIKTKNDFEHFFCFFDTYFIIKDFLLYMFYSNLFKKKLLNFYYYFRRILNEESQQRHLWSQIETRESALDRGPLDLGYGGNGGYGGYGGNDQTYHEIPDFPRGLQYDRFKTLTFIMISPYIFPT